MSRDAADLLEVVAALGALEAAVDVDLPAWMSTKRKRSRVHKFGVAHERVAKSLRNRLDYARKRRLQAEAKGRELQQAREHDVSHRITAAFVAHIALSAPSDSSRAFANAWSDAVGVATAACSRRSIGRVRDAFTYVVKDLYFSRLQEEARDAFAAAAALASPAASAPAATAIEVAASFAPPCFAALLHFHDEASLRLRSSADVGGAPSRVRSSKVTQHVVWADFGLGGVHHFLPTELHALENKKATVLAHCIHNVLVSAASHIETGFAAASAPADPVAAAPDSDSTKPWLFHILVGDAIATNLAAAKILLPWTCRSLPKFRYFLFVVKCASHQVNLVLSAAATGGPAACAALQADSVVRRPDAFAFRQVEARTLTSPLRNLCGVTVRLYKYLVPLYYEVAVTH